MHALRMDSGSRLLMVQQKCACCLPADHDTWKPALDDDQAAALTQSLMANVIADGLSYKLIHFLKISCLALPQPQIKIGVCTVVSTYFHVQLIRSFLTHVQHLAAEHEACLSFTKLLCVRSFWDRLPLNLIPVSN